MKTIISFVSMLVAIVMFSGCTPGSIANLGVSLIDSHMKARAEDATARRQAKYIAEEINKKREYTKQDFKTPDKVVRINEEAEVYMYNTPENKIKLFAFIGNKLQGTGSGNAAEANKPDDQLRKEFINTFPCYEHLRIDAVTGEPPLQKSPDSSKESIIKTKGKPNNVVKIDDAGSEVWEYYDSPEKGKVRLYAFLNGELKNVGSRNMDEYGANSNDIVFLKKRYIDTVPCYASLRNTPAPDNTPAATPEPTPAPMKSDNPK